MENTCEHPIVFLKDIKIGEVRAILDYMYKGEVNVAQEELPGLLKVAELLRVKGLVEGDGDKLLNSNKNGGRPLVTTSMNEPPTSSTKLNGGHGVGGGQDGPGGVRGSEDSRRSSSISENQRDRDNSATRQGDNNGPKLGESPTSAGAAQAQAAAAAAAAASQRGLPFMLNPQAGGMPFPTFPIPGMFPNLLGARDGLHNRAARMDQDAGSENEREGSPSPGYKRKKVASGSGGSSSSKESVGMGHRDDQPLAMDLGRERGDDKGIPHDLEKEMMAQGLDKSGIANYVPSQRLEWKRYKQYTRSDIMAAIEEVKSGMSALQASRKYGVPSRTLYDKVKKMGITTGRQVQRKSLPNYPAQFPGLSGMMNIDERDDTNDSSLGAPGEEPRATMVPPTSLSTYMLNIMKGIQPDHGGVGKGPGESEISLTPMNLSTMLSSHSGSNKLQPRPLPPGTDNSLSPRSPRPHQRDLEDDIVDSTDPRDQMQPAGSGGISVGHRARHSSGGSVGDPPRRGNAHPTHRELNEADIKSQFLADLRRLGGNIPNPNNGDMHHHQLATASSTTNSPPAPAPATPTDENSLPPRKRKVSHEGAAHVTPTKQPIMTAHIAQAPRSPYNGISSHDSDSIAVKNEGVNNSSETENSSTAAASVDCRN